MWSDDFLPRLRLLRCFLSFVVLVLALLALAIGAAFTPFVQTWLAEWALGSVPGWQVSIGSVSAGLSHLRLADLRVESGGAVLTVPALEARLPLKTALWDRTILIGSLQAKGWILDLSRRPTAPGGGPSAPAAAPAQTASTPPAAGDRSGLLRGWQLPVGASLDGLEVEGEILFATPGEKDPVPVHVTAAGGGIAAGRTGSFTLDLNGIRAGQRPAAAALAAHGRLRVDVGVQGNFSRVEFAGRLAAADSSLPGDLSLTAAIATTGDTGADTYTVDVIRADRRLASFVARVAPEPGRWAGTWKLDLQDDDLAKFLPDRRLPALAAAGEGRFDTDAAFSRIDAAGRLKIASNHPGEWLLAFSRLGAVTLDTTFDLTRRWHLLEVKRLEASLAGTQPIATVHSVQTFVVDATTGDVELPEPNADWLLGSLQECPVAALPALADGLALTGRDATGDFAVKVIDGGFALRSTKPFTTTGVSVHRAGHLLGRDLDVSLALLATHTAKQGWQVQGKPLTLSSGGRHLATIEAKLSPLAGAGGRAALTATWTADLDALASQPALAETGWLRGRSATGEVSGYVGPMVDLKGKINVIGHDPSHALDASGHIVADTRGGVVFKTMVKIVAGAEASEFSAEGTSARGKSGRQVEVDLNAVKFNLAHLGLLAAAVPLPNGVTWPALQAAWHGGAPGTAPPRDPQPFWGDWVGRVKINCYQLQAGNLDGQEVGGTLELAPASLRLVGGHGAFAPLKPAKVAAPIPGAKASAPDDGITWVRHGRAAMGEAARGKGKEDAPRSQATAEGVISFDAAAATPYGVKATTTVDTVDLATWLGSADAGSEPVVEGRCAATGTLTADGVNLADLVARRREELRLTNRGGILRLLKTNTAESILETPAPVKDAIASVGSAFGTLLGLDRNALFNGQGAYSKAAEAILDFTPQVAEIRCDNITLTAVRGADRTIHLTQIAATAPNGRVTGSGEITAVPGRPFRAQPLSLDLQLGFRGPLAAPLATAGLLSADTGSDGYTNLRQPVHFGGTLEKVDESQWRELLVKAANAPAEHGKKGR